MQQEFLKNFDEVIGAGPFRDDWTGPLKVPAWYQCGKFGIFIHWGVYSVPAFGNEWYPRNMYSQGCPNSSIIVPPMERSASSVIRISFRNLTPKL